ncbi:MAG: tyrosine-type recombinase/integrase, partial [Curvibacter sp.]
MVELGETEFRSATRKKPRFCLAFWCFSKKLLPIADEIEDQMPLTERQIRAFSKNPTPGYYPDQDGLALQVDKAGRMYWQWRTKGANGKNTTVSYGPWPLVNVDTARLKHREAKLMRLKGEHPNAAKRKARQLAMTEALNTFGVVCREWLSVQATKWSEGHLKTTRERVERDLKGLERRPMNEIDPPELLRLLRKIEARGAVETAHRVRIIMSQVFTYAMAMGKATRNPAAELAGVLEQPKEGHHAAVTDPKQLGQLIRDIRAYRGSEIVRSALELHALLFQRPNEIRGMRWDELDLDAALWTIPAERMKRKKQGKLDGDPHLVPLSRQAVTMLKSLKTLTGGRELVFPSQRGQGRCISENTCRQALRTLGYSNEDHTPHGFRATARTLLDERLGVRVEVIEAQLAHNVPDSLGRAYNRTTFVDERRRMMQQWADYLD